MTVLSPRIRDYQKERQQAFRRVMVALGSVVVAVFVVVLFMLHEDSGRRCVELGLDPQQEEVCLRFESKGGISKSRID